MAGAPDGRQARPDPSSFLVVTQYYAPERGAAQVRLGALARELQRRGARVEVLTALPNYPLGRIFDGWSRRPVQVADEGGVRVIRVWLWASMGSGVERMVNYASFGLMSLLGLLRTRPADWTIVEYPTLFGALPAAVWGRIRRRKVVVNVADLWVDAIVELGALSDGAVVKVLRRVRGRARRRRRDRDRPGRTSRCRHRWTSSRCAADRRPSRSGRPGRRRSPR